MTEGEILQFECLGCHHTVIYERSLLERVLSTNPTLGCYDCGQVMCEVQMDTDQEVSGRE